MRFFRWTLVVIISFVAFQSMAQTLYIDSLKNALKTNKASEADIKEVWFPLGRELSMQNLDASMTYYQAILDYT